MLGRRFNKVKKMYNKYEKALQQEFDFSFNSYAGVVHSNGNEIGIYQDVGLLLSRLSADSHTSFVLEFGSGMSTLVLANVCGKHNKRLITIERLKKWYDISLKNLKDLSLDGNLEFVCVEGEESKLPVVDSPVSFVWVDGSISDKRELQGRLGACDYYWEYLKDAVLLFDDAQWEAEPRIEWLCGKDRREDLWFIFNPTGRGDRHVLVSFPYEDHPFLDIVRSCVL